MTFTNIQNKLPKCVRVDKMIEKIDLILHGQGVVIFNSPGPCEFRITDSSGTSGLKVQFTETDVLINMYPSNEPLIDHKNSRGIVKAAGAYYWLSLDSQNQLIHAGIGEARKENIIYEFKCSPQIKSFLEKHTTVYSDTIKIMSILRDPITTSIPLLIKNTDDLTMDAIASGKYMPKANLSLTSQKLYDCISGKKFVLNTPDFRSLTRAIEYSIATPGKWCYERLKAKANEFDKDKPNVKETYLRITLGQNNGESPGIPYVMEIWPVGHYSPIHNHGGSSAIIRVLNGSINVSLFPFLSADDVVPFANANFVKDDITWISPTLNQVHQLKNIGTNTCITIQCYMYEDSDTTHYDYFDYLDGKKTGQFEPDSDMDFIEFKATMKKEWAERKRCWL
jgi:hypothetical protein